MSEVQKQALIRFVRVLIVAMIAAVIANSGLLITIVGDSPVGQTIVMLVVIPLLDAIAKLLGGATESVETPAIAAGSTARRRLWFLSV